MPKPLSRFKRSTRLKIREIEAILFRIAEGEYPSYRMPFLLEGRSSCNISLVDSRYVVSFSDGHKEYITIDKVKHTLSIQGEWWYKGIYSLQEQEKKTLISLSVYNVAQNYRWAASLMMLLEKSNHRMGFEKLITRLETENSKQFFI